MGFSRQFGRSGRNLGILTSAGVLDPALVNLGLMPPGNVTPPASSGGGGGTDTRTQVDFATGPPTKPAGVVANVFNSQFQILSEQASGDGIIHMSGWHVYTGDPSQAAFLSNCGATPIDWSNSIIISPQGFTLQGGENMNLKMRNVAMYGQQTTLDGSSRRPRHINAYRPSNIDLAYITQEAGGGIYLDHWAGNNSASQQVRISNLRSRNIIGSNNGPDDYRSVVQLNNVVAPGYLKYVDSVNEPNKSRVEDQFNLYDSGGPNANTLFLCEGIYGQGSWPYTRERDIYTGAIFSIDGTGGSSASPGTSNTYTNKLWCVSGGNAACNIAIGHNNIVDNLYAVSSGYFADGQPSFSTYSGCAVIDYYNTGTVLGNFIRSPKLGWIRTKDTPASTRTRLDVSPASLSGGVTNPYSIAGDITLETERLAFVDFVNYLNSVNQTCGNRFTF